MLLNCVHTFLLLTTCQQLCNTITAKWVERVDKGWFLVCVSTTEIVSKIENYKFKISVSIVKGVVWYLFFLPVLKVNDMGSLQACLKEVA